ncbi:Tau-tubulin kinase [Dirofilaria immitis]
MLLFELMIIMVTEHSPTRSIKKSPAKISAYSKVSIKNQNGEKVSKKITVEMLKIDETLRNRYTIEKRLGRSNYSEIYRAYDKVKSRLVAVKIATHKMDPRRMKIEQMVLTLLRGKVISALHDLHAAGFLHRDIKPSNICIGRGVQRRIIYLLDHGMARMFTEIDGTIRKPRSQIGFRGTLRYVSSTVHSRHETGPRDDLISWFYSMIELINGKLPWSDLNIEKDVGEAKKNATLESLCKNQPNTSLEFAKYITSLDTITIPNYEKMYTIFRTIVLTKYKDDSPFEWEVFKSDKIKRKVHEDGNIINQKATVG